MPLHIYWDDKKHCHEELLTIYPIFKSELEIEKTETVIVFYGRMAFE